MNITAKLLEKFDTQPISDSFQKREFVVEFSENPQYPEFLKFELIQNNCTQLDPFNVGDEISISFNLKGRKWTDPQGNVKYFNSLQAWRLEKAGNEQPQPPQQEPNTDWMTDSGESSDDDLPF
jgi:hypothetical protein